MAIDINEVKPRAQWIDAKIAEYQELKEKADVAGAAAKLAADAAGVVKAELTELVEKFGARHTEKSKKLAGVHNTATTTTATRVTIDAERVEELRVWLDKESLPDVAQRFFVEQKTYSLVEGPAEVLKTLTLGRRIQTKITAMLGLCFAIKTNAPSLKVEVVTPEKPTAA